MSEQEEKEKIKSVLDILKNINLYRIPIYQRPYKWTEKNVLQLIGDINDNKRKEEYRLGTIILHKNKDEHGSDKYDIVDGQQRFVTLLLLACHLPDEFLPLKKDDLRCFELPNSNISKKNILHNNESIKSQAHLFNRNFCNFLLQNCTFVRIELEELSEAFQFFDSQNARGKALAPHDLLKAFHLREMQDVSFQEKQHVVEQWESVETAELRDLFAVYLYRVRKWIRGDKAASFTKDTVDHFKGVSADAIDRYPFARSMHVVDRYVDDYNHSLHSTLHTEMSYPFQLDAPIINGARFFEMVAHYLQLFRQLYDLHDLRDEAEHYQSLLHKVTEGADGNLCEKQDISIIEKWKLSREAVCIMYALANYNGRWRTGDRYTRILFDCCLAYYLDKFGTEDISEAIIIAFKWAYFVRLTLARVSWPSVENRALGDGGLFKQIHAMLSPAPFLKRAVPKVRHDQIKSASLVEEWRKKKIAKFICEDDELKEEST